MDSLLGQIGIYDLLETKYTDPKWKAGTEFHTSVMKAYMSKEAKARLGDGASWLPRGRIHTT